MIAQFTIHTMGHSGTHKSQPHIAKILARSGLHYHLGPTCAVLEGPWADVLTVVQECHSHALHESDRVVTTIVLDDRKASSNELRELLSSLERERAAAAEGSEGDPLC